MVFNWLPVRTDRCGFILQVYGGNPDEESGSVNCCRGSRVWLFYRHGYPLALLSDQCPNVDGKLVREVCERYGIEKLHSSAYHPEGDGKAERTIQSFKQCMRCCLEERKISQTNWPKLTQEISFICNSQINASTKCTPHEVMFGEKLRSKVDVILPQNEHASYDDPASFIRASIK